ncbi:hypothetical protein AALB39_27065 [Lachnospiraceae bacterium 54-53]
MSNYRRLISYIYAYEGGIKGKNIGFAKIETRGIQCKITVSVKRIYVGGNDIGVYLLAGEQEIFLGNIFIRGGSGEFRTTVSSSDIEHSGICMDQCFGLTIHDVKNTWRSYTTIWEDAVAHAAEVDLENTVSVSREKHQTTVSEDQIKRAVQEIEEEFPLKPDEELKTTAQESSSKEEEGTEASSDVPETERDDTVRAGQVDEEGDHLQTEMLQTESKEPEGVSGGADGDAALTASEEPEWNKPEGDSADAGSVEAQQQDTLPSVTGPAPDGQQGTRPLMTGPAPGWWEGIQPSTTDPVQIEQPETGPIMTGPVPAGQPIPGMTVTGPVPTGQPIPGMTVTGPMPAGQPITGPAMTGPVQPGQPMPGTTMTGPIPTGQPITGPAMTGPVQPGQPMPGTTMTGPMPAGQPITGPVITDPIQPAQPMSGPAMTGPVPAGQPMPGPTMTGPVQPITGPIQIGQPFARPAGTGPIPAVQPFTTGPVPTGRPVPRSSATRQTSQGRQITGQENRRSAARPGQTESVSAETVNYGESAGVFNDPYTPQSSQEAALNTVYYRADAALKDDRSRDEVQPKLGNPAELERLLQNEDPDESSHDLVWEKLKREHTRILAFDYEDGCEILTIKPQDIGLLPRDTWVYGNNSFLLHGYYNYRYLILAKLLNPQGMPRYLLGIPGHYYSNERYMASMFGFPNFVLSKEQPMEDGRFGFWYTDIKLGG